MDKDNLTNKKARNKSTNNLIIKDVIRAHGYTLKSLAEQMDVNYVSFKQLLARDMKVSTLERVASEINCSPRDFFPIEKKNNRISVPITNLSVDASGNIVISPADSANDYVVSGKDVLTMLAKSI